MNFVKTIEGKFFLIFFLIDLITIIIIWRKRHVQGMHWLILGMVATSIYSFFAMMDSISATLESRIFWSKLGYLGANSVIPFLLLFFLNYPIKSIRLKPIQIAAVFLIPLLTILALMVNETHYLFWTSFEPISGTSNGIIFHHGPLHWIVVGYNGFCGLLIVAQIFFNVLHFTGIYKHQSILLLISSFMPILAEFLYDSRKNPIAGMDLLPIGLTLSGIGITSSIVFFQMFDMVPVSRSILIENLQDGMIVLDDQRRIVDINSAAKRLLQNPKITIGKNIDELGDQIRLALSQNKDEVELTLTSPETRYLLLTSSVLPDETSQFAGKLFTIRDMTEIRKVEKALNQSQERYRSLIEDVVDVSSVGICILDDQFRIIWENKAASKMWNFSQNPIIGTDIRELLQNYRTDHIENGEEFVDRVLESYASAKYLEDVEIHFHENGNSNERWILYSSKPVRVGFYTGGRIEQYIDISEKNRLLAKLELSAITDELTGIYNRRGLMELGLHDFNRAQRTNTQLCVIYFDIDHFKDLNDTFGHANADKILIELVERIQNSLRNMDIFSRYGGDEFIILVPDADIRQGNEIAERIRKLVISKPFLVNGKELKLTCSFGIVQINQQDTFSTLLDRADKCMYHAKQNGGNRVEIEKDH